MRPDRLTIMPYRHLVFLLIALALSAPAARAESPTAWLARLVSPSLRAHDGRVAVLRRELETLPPEPGDQSAERLGWHSRLTRSAEPAPKSITVDLGETMDFDTVVLVPVNAAVSGPAAPGYGFPVRFRVEVLDEGSAALPVTLADSTGHDFPSPGNLPVVIEAPSARGRYVRVTATRLFTRDGFALFALGELMVLRGQRNLAAGAQVIASENYANAPAWDLANVTDGQSVLGPPIQIERTPGYGYHGTIERGDAATKWVQLDLGSEQVIDEVRLYAARPKDFPPRRGFGFPLRFRVEASANADFTQPILLGAWT